MGNGTRHDRTGEERRTATTEGFEVGRLLSLQFSSAPSSPHFGGARTHTNTPPRFFSPSRGIGASAPQ